jgi:hypothetical protein
MKRIHTAPCRPPPSSSPGAPTASSATPVAVEVVQAGQRVAEEVSFEEVAAEAAQPFADLLPGRHGPVGIQEEDPHRSLARWTRVVGGNAHREIAHAVAVQVADGRQRGPETIVGLQDAAESAHGLADLRLSRRPCRSLRERRIQTAPWSWPPSSSFGAPTARSVIPSPSTSPSAASEEPK